MSHSKSIQILTLFQRIGKSLNSQGGMVAGGPPGGLFVYIEKYVPSYLSEGTFIRKS